LSAREQIVRLEAILARVTARAAAPRRANGLDASASAREVEPPPPDEPVVSYEEAPIDIEVSELTEETPPVVERIAAEELPQAPQRVPHLPEEVESRERIIAAPPQPLPGDDREPETAPVSAEREEPRGPSLSAEPEEAEPASDGPDISVHELPADAVDEPPASSRRPIALEPKLEELAFGEAAPMEESPHTPPPESGRQVAASPVDLDFEGEFTGVRPREPEPLAVTVIAEAKPAEALKLAPETTVAALPDLVPAVYAGATPVFKPATFGELLDATLTL
jgi:hypothetical protein